MRINPPLLLLFLLCFSLSLAAKENYAEYYRLVNRAEEKFILAGDKSCFRDYDHAFRLNKPFLKDPFIASQIALYLKDTAKCLSYLEICFRNGMPFSSLPASRLYQAAGGEFGERLQTLFNKSYQAPRIDSVLNERLCLLCYQSDSFKVKAGGRSTAFYANENSSRQLILDSCLMRGLFPNEKLVGISTDRLQEDFFTKYNRRSVYEDAPFAKTAENFDELELRRKCPYNIILHSKCFFRNYQARFFEAMMAGYLHPKEYAMLEETSIIWGESNRNPADTCEPARPRICYNIFGKSPMSAVSIVGQTPAELEEVEKNRAAIYMQKYAVDVAKKKAQKETGIKFFFDFADR